MSIEIIGTGGYVPEKIITNDDLSQMVETSDEWITQRVGVKERHVSVDETTADLAVKAARQALEAAGIQPGQLGLIITATVTGDTLCPSTAALVQAAIGADCPAFDISSACSGFLFALDTAAAFIAGALGAYRLILMTDIAGILKDPKDPATLIPRITVSEAEKLEEQGIISGGMIPKVACCVEAIHRGVRKVIIMDGRIPHSILLELFTDEGAGTMVTGD